jgi:cytochrome c-type biogenesis protein CcmH/NrfG
MPRSGGTSQAAAAGAPVARPLKYSRWRAAGLVMVYLLFGIHIAHWRIHGSTLAPLELNEVLYTVELGILTAGFLFMVVALLSVLVFGRFFCSWMCHILALEDLSAWLLKKVGIRPRVVRSRVLLLVPLSAMAYMFIWPQITRLAEGRPLPALHIRTDTAGWASFVTTNFWRNLPGPWIIALTFGVCGFAIVYFLGSRSFCTNGCPYGVVFGFADRFAPGKIVATGECAECGICTSVCQSHVQVQEETRLYGKVVSPSCLKDLDCTSACPNERLHFGFTKPSFFTSWRRDGRRAIPYDFSLGEDLLMAAVFLVTLFVFRGLYQAVPFIMTLGLCGILAYLSVLTVRVIRKSDVRLNTLQLKQSGRMTTRGWVFAALAAALAIFIVHSGFIRYHEVKGKRAFEALEAGMARDRQAQPELLTASLSHLQFCDTWGLIRPPDLDRKLARLYMATGSPAEAEAHIRRALANQPQDGEWRIALAAVLLTKSKVDEAVAELHSVTAQESSPDPGDTRAGEVRAQAHVMLGQIFTEKGDMVSARREFRAALEANPSNQDAAAALRSLDGSPL